MSANTRVFKKKKISRFFDDEFSLYCSYDNIRSIPSLSGFKNSGQKIVWTLFKGHLKEFTKVQRFATVVSIETEYLHGNASLEGTTSGLAVQFNCSGNNLPIFDKDGNFGSRIDTSIGASRYVKVNTASYFFNIFRKEDNLIYKPQIFEGNEIEPQNLYPIIPMGLVNLTSGTGNGFANFIMPRNPKDIIKALINKLDNKKITTKDLPHYFKGFTGKTEYVSDKTNGEYEWNFVGTVTKKDMYTILIKDVVPKHNLDSYTNVLKELRDNKKIIKSFRDLSDKDILDFEIKVSGDFWTTYNTEAKLITLFDMNDKSKENFTYIYDNKVKTVNNIVEYIDDYFTYRLNAYVDRKAAQLLKLQDEIEILDSKYRFVKAVIDGHIVVNNKNKSEILSDIKKVTPALRLVENNYDYLLRMPIYSLSKEKLEELKKECEKTMLTKENLEKTKVEDIWKQELKELEKLIK